jgi:hypothetical protein
MPTQIEVPTDAREMHGGIFSSETTQLPPALVFFLSMILKNNVDIEVESAQPLLAELEEEILVVREATEEQTIARTLLFRFGLPYLPGAEEVWEILGGYLVNAKEATKEARVQLKQTINHLQALLITQLTTEQESQLEAIELEEKQHRQGITTLQKSSSNLVDESPLASQNNDAITQKKERLMIISTQKGQIRNSIESMRAMISNLLMNFSSIQQFDSTQLVMA